MRSKDARTVWGQARWETTRLVHDKIHLVVVRLDRHFSITVFRLFMGQNLDKILMTWNGIHARNINNKLALVEFMGVEQCI
jgi:hypothetical protein